MTTLRDRFSGAMLGSALGDALGAIFEGSAPARRSPKIKYFPNHLTYTDDTEMSIGVAESLVEGLSPAGIIEENTLVKNFLKNFNPLRGYGWGALQTLGLLREGMPWQEASRAVFPEGSKGNGAAMRAIPLGLFYWQDMERLQEAVRTASAITHSHPVGIEGALLIAASTAFLLREEEILPGLLKLSKESPLREKLLMIPALLREEADFHDVAARLGNGVLAEESVPTAIYAFLKYGGGFRKTIQFCLDLGGDTDTIASMAGGLAGAADGTERIPPEWIERLERRDYIEDLSERLYEKAS